jgi:hypothetical protein
MLARLACLTATLLAFSNDALAQPEVRDHRSAPAAAPAPAPQATVRYRRRPGPRFMMPLKVDIGAASINSDRGFVTGIGAAVGIHWASLSPNPTQTDIGLGVFGAIAATPEDTTVMDDKPTVAQGGAYLELGHTLSHGDFWRTWGTGRAEYLGSSAFGEDHVGIGATGRLSAELYISGVGIEPRGLFLGTYAIGLYVEAGYRDTVVGVSNIHAGAGLTFRTPLVFAP